MGDAGGTGGSVRPEADQTDGGARVRARRQAVGLTQAQLAQDVGVSRQTIITMESGNYAPSVFLALRVARALEVTVEDLWASRTSDDVVA
jgi:putative transcriptional regulator